MTTKTVSPLDEGVLSQFEAVCRERGWDTVTEVATLRGFAVYLLSSSVFHPHGKIGLPPYYYVDSSGQVCELEYEDVFTVLDLVYGEEDVADGSGVEQ